MNWGLFMKTKIIYISGSEIFQMSDVRAAFDTVRRELGLGSDTVLFGVPVDAEDALGGQFETATPSVVQNITATETPDVEPVATVAEVSFAAPVVDEEIAPEPEVKAKPKRTRKKVVAVAEEVIEEPVVEEKTEDEKSANNDAIIPILSVLGSDKEPEVMTTDNVEPTGEIIEDLFDETPEAINPTVSFDAADIDDEIPTIEPQVAKVNDIDEEDDSLEKLLQSVQSLHEDKEEVEEEKIAEPVFDETDATLEKLANEFAENQDKIVNTTKSSARGGRIGKLKNILPFKKVKHNDSSLMGDLFGWAGVAANDEEFGIPEFFPTAAKK